MACGLSEDDMVVQDVSAQTESVLTGVGLVVTSMTGLYRNVTVLVLTFPILRFRTASPPVAFLLRIGHRRIVDHLALAEWTSSRRAGCYLVAC